MKLVRLHIHPDFRKVEKLAVEIQKLELLLAELQQRKLPDHVIALINPHTEKLNQISATQKRLVNSFRTVRVQIIRILEKELKLVPKNYYRTLWLSVGMAAFGLPLGCAFGLIMGNISLLGIGLPFGMAIGLVVGNQMDKKAAEEDRQLKNHY